MDKQSHWEIDPGTQGNSHMTQAGGITNNGGKDGLFNKWF